MQRKLRVCDELPPRQARGAASSKRTCAPASAAIKAAHNAALPPPITSTCVCMSHPSRSEEGGIVALVHCFQK
jgi:hypothetical protein